MSDVDDNVERWPDATLGGSVWKRDPVTKIFSLVKFRNKHVDKRWGNLEIAKSLKCGFNSLSENGVPGEIFPPEFKYSPNTGKPIDIPESVAL